MIGGNGIAARMTLARRTSRPIIAGVLTAD
jgi:hypothetical protein